MLSGEAFPLLPTTYDPIFQKYGGDVPVAYLRALASRESDMNPHEAQMPAYGLLQVILEVVQSYNSRKGTSYSHADMLTPELNVKVAANLINRIAKGYGPLHPHADNMQEDWTNPEFAKLVTTGWNSGYSEIRGVGKVAQWLEQNSLPVTHDNVLDYAQQAGGVRYLYQNKERTRNWQRSVVDLYLSQPDAPTVLGGVVGFAFGAAIGYLIARYVF